MANAIAVMLVPTLVYGLYIFREQFPKINQVASSTISNMKALTSPLFLFMMFCMTLTATTELGTQQWVERILSASGVSPMLIMALTTGLMAVGRFFAGAIIHHLNPIIGGIDSALSKVLLTGMNETQVDLIAGQTVLANLSFFPLSLIFAFGALYCYILMRNNKVKVTEKLA